MIELQSAFVCTARVSLGELIVVGPCPLGLRRYVPILGGTVSGPLLNGRVLVGGDSQVLRADLVLAVDASYLIETHDGVRIGVVNRGIRHGPAEVIARLSGGQPVQPGEYYFRTAAQFEAPVGSPYEWVNKTLFAATAEREPNTAIVHFFRIL